MITTINEWKKNRLNENSESYPRIYADVNDPVELYVRDANTAFLFSFNPVSRPMPGEESWPITSIVKIEGTEEVKKMIHDCLNPDNEGNGFTQPDEMQEPMEDHTAKSTEEDFEKIENRIKKYGDNYDRANDYNRVFGTTSNEEYIGEKGLERVRKMLHKNVDRYVNSLSENSDKSSDDFYIKDFAKVATNNWDLFI